MSFLTAALLTTNYISLFVLFCLLLFLLEQIAVFTCRHAVVKGGRGSCGVNGQLEFSQS